MSASENGDGDRGDLPAFPAERDWLALTPPPMNADFVDATVARVLADRTAGGWGGDAGIEADAEPAVAALDAAADESFAQPSAAELEAPVLSRAALAAFAPPEPSRDFVARTVDLVQRDFVAHWRALLSRHIAPEAGPDFVARTLAALRRDREGAPVLRFARSPAVWISAAAALLLAFFAMREPARRPVEAEVVAGAPIGVAWSRSHSPLPALHTLVRGASTDEADEDELEFTPPDAVYLWLATGTQR